MVRGGRGRGGKGGNVLIQQAIFTSVRSGRNEGYQIAASSPGISADALRELAQWGPGHDSLYSELPGPESVNFHRMENGLFCVSHTCLSGREYSGRGGQRLYTHSFLIPPELLQRFANSPFRVMESLVVSGRCSMAPTVPLELEPINLVGRAALVNGANIEHVARILGPQKLAALVNAGLHGEALGIASPLSGKRLCSALLDLLPPFLRPEYPLTTGLKVSAVRPYRLAVLPAKAEEQRRAARTARLDVLDLTKDLPARFTPNRGWPLLVFQLLRDKQYETLVNVIEHAAHSDEHDLEMLTEQQQQRLAKAAEPAPLTQLPASVS